MADTPGRTFSQQFWARIVGRTILTDVILGLRLILTTVSPSVLIVERQGIGPESARSRNGVRQRPKMDKRESQTQAQRKTKHSG